MQRKFYYDVSFKGIKGNKAVTGTETCYLYGNLHTMRDREDLKQQIKAKHDLAKVSLTFVDFIGADKRL